MKCRGSPIIALRAALEHSPRLSQNEVRFAFVEQDQARADNLQTEIARLNLPQNFQPLVIVDTFEAALRRSLDSLDARGLQMAPTFALVDPFGISGIPFSLLSRLLRRQKCEVLVTFMTETIKRFVTELPQHVNELIGNGNAATELAATPSKDRVARARQLYEGSLRSVARFVRFFELRNRNNVPLYDLFFATNHPLGHLKMKEAMWKVDESGDFSFSDATNPNQVRLFRSDPATEIAPELLAHFRGQGQDADTVRTYVEDNTPYLTKHANAALVLLETSARITVDENKRDGSRRRAKSFPSGTTVHFPA